MVDQMSPKKRNPHSESLDSVLAAVRKREKEYRERALKIYPWICARCGREFAGERLKELTVHHKDHDHDNNPPDGSNWELLCLYCHENEHAPYLTKEWYENALPDEKQKPQTTFRPFADLQKILDEKDDR